jgi:uncharacterized protein YegL
MQSLITPSNYQFSAPPVDALGADSYTLVGIANDISGSVSSHVREMIGALKAILNGCAKKCPRAENLMMRLTGFSNGVGELHGFREVITIDEKEYDSILNCGGSTALNDGCFEMIESLVSYAKVLRDNNFSANGIIFVITDGEENNSKHSASAVKDLIAKVNKDESLESLQIILIGVTKGDAHLAKVLSDFQAEVGIDKYINVDDATAGKLAKLAEWVSQSISSTSQALGTGGKSQLTGLSF